MLAEKLPVQCNERERLLAILRDAIRGLIQARGQLESDTALANWEEARRALMEHMREHGC